MTTRHILAVLLTSAAVAAGCGDEEPTDGEPTSKRATLALRHAQLEKDPYALRCADIRDKIASARITRVVQYALADDAKISGLNRLQASQSIFYAITELCRSKPASYEPARDAIEAVRSGELRADLGTP